MSSLFDYLSGKRTTKRKGKKPDRQKRIKWGTKQPKYNNKQTYKQKDDKIEKLLELLISRTGPTNSIELARQKQIEGDYQLAQDLATKEQMKKKTKVVEEEVKPPIVEAEKPKKISNVSGTQRFQAYDLQYQSIEEGYNGMIEDLKEFIGNETAVMSGGAMSDILQKKEQLSNDRNVLRKELLEDITKNPSDVWEWRGYIEHSENATENLLELDNKVSSIIYDQSLRNISEREALSAEQVAQAEKTAKLMEADLKRTEIEKTKEEEFNKQLKEVNSQLTEQKLKLIKEATEKETLIEDLDKTQKFLSENITENFNSGEEKLRNYLAGNITGNDNKFKVGLGQTGLGDFWDTMTDRNNKTEDRKRLLKKELNKKKEEQEQFLPKKVESFMSALPPGSIMLQREDSSELLSRATSEGSLTSQEKREIFEDEGIVIE